MHPCPDGWPDIGNISDYVTQGRRRATPMSRPIERVGLRRHYPVTLMLWGVWSDRDGPRSGDIS